MIDKLCRDKMIYNERSAGMISSGAYNYINVLE